MKIYEKDLSFKVESWSGIKEGVLTHIPSGKAWSRRFETWRHPISNDEIKKILIEKMNHRVFYDPDYIPTGKKPEPALFCPLLNEPCRKDCASWSEYKEVVGYGGQMYYREAGCRNPNVVKGL